MQYNASTPAEYLDQLDDDWRKEKVLQVREMIKNHDPELVEGIEYKMLSYGDDSRSVFHLNAQRAHVGLYVGNLDKIEGSSELLTDFDTGKGCIRIKKKNDLSQPELDTFIGNTIAFWRAGGDTEC